ncbi:hypothetical protein SDC9_127480 [bioreactor metagenome]|uniref:Uncharacterized protein n=1 Tax=bioreactor metagenome TaxID=1076179 RepID=A0A645CU45_9ZZZZ
MFTEFIHVVRHGFRIGNHEQLDRFRPVLLGKIGIVVADDADEILIIPGPRALRIAVVKFLVQVRLDIHAKRFGVVDDLIGQARFKQDALNNLAGRMLGDLRAAVVDDIPFKTKLVHIFFGRTVRTARAKNNPNAFVGRGAHGGHNACGQIFFVVNECVVYIEHK